MTPSSTDFALRRLSESEIQDRLYGEYHGRRRRQTVVDTVTLAEVTPPEFAPAPVERSRTTTVPVAPAVPTVSEPCWTGEEILREELSRLTQELTTLRREQFRLESEMTRRSASTPVAAAPSQGAVVRLPSAALGTPTVRVMAAPASRSSTSSVGPGLWMVAGLLIVGSAMAAVVFHAMVLEAQPLLLGAPMPGSLYSLQVGVYDGRPMAQQFTDQLSQAGYPAFLVERPARSGRSRYRVYVGRYTSRVEAQVQLDLLQHHSLLRDSFILKRH